MINMEVRLAKYPAFKTGSIGIALILTCEQYISNYFKNLINIFVKILIIFI